MKVRTGFVTNSSSSSFLISLLEAVSAVGGAGIGIFLSQVFSSPPAAGVGAGSKNEQPQDSGNQMAGPRGTPAIGGERILEGQDALDWLTERGFLVSPDDAGKNEQVGEEKPGPERVLTNNFWEWWDLPWSGEGDNRGLQLICGELDSYERANQSIDLTNNLVIVVSDSSRPDRGTVTEEERPPAVEQENAVSEDEAKPETESVTLLGESVAPEAEDHIPGEGEDLPGGEKDDNTVAVQPIVQDELPPAEDDALELLGISPDHSTSDESPEGEGEEETEEAPAIFELSALIDDWEEKLNNVIQERIKDDSEKSELFNSMDRVFQVELTGKDGSSEHVQIELHNGRVSLRAEDFSGHGQPNVSFSLPRNVFNDLVAGHTKLDSISSVSSLLARLDNFRFDDSVDVLLDLFDADQIVKRGWNVFKRSPRMGQNAAWVVDLFRNSGGSSK